mmetsp:Transcript_23149/g.28416  ORF Transcript_23149/g.28416 Transcript_23149/m.28416 type:complete len:501 (+) Transcript_23149:108-1610(+)
MRKPSLRSKQLGLGVVFVVAFSFFRTITYMIKNRVDFEEKENISIDINNDLLFLKSPPASESALPVPNIDVPLNLTSAAARNTDKAIDNEVVHISSNYTLSSDVMKVTHSPKDHEIHIHLKTPSDHRRCKNPTFEGRISGPYLALLKWEHDSIFADPNKTNNVIIGTYQVPSAGVYFIEIVAMLCDSITFRSNFKTQCLEDARNNRITNIGATINVLAPSSKVTTDSDFPLGFWKWKGDIEGNPNKSYTPLLFRFQPAGCYLANTLECQEYASLARFEDYDFVWNDLSIEDSMYLGSRSNWNRTTGDLTQFQGGSNATVCLAGSSHSRNMQKQMEWLKVNQSIKLRFYNMEFQRPNQVRDLVQEFTTALAGCNFTVIATGQWSASFAGGRPFLMFEWEDITRKIIDTVKIAGSYPIIRLLHKQPVSQRQATCPPMDWRVHALSGYNEVLLKIGKEMNIPVIDTRFIISPMFDSYEDFMHPKLQPAWRECNHIMREFLKIT